MKLHLNIGAGRRLTAFSVGLFLLAGMALAAHRAARAETQTVKTPAETVLLGGKILTLDDRNRTEQALAIGDGRIVAVGSDAKIEKHIGGATKVIRLDGRTVIPGIIQTHSHAIGVARHSLWQTHQELTSIAQIQQWIRQEAQATPPGRWIQVPRADITRLKERRHPTPAELDAACTTRPVAFNAARKWVLNTVGWEMSGLVEEAKKDSRIRIIPDQAGRPRLVDGADAHLRPLLPGSNIVIASPTKSATDRPGSEVAGVAQVYTHDQQLAALVRLLRRYNEVGITSIFERASGRDGYDLYQSLRRRGELTVRVTVTMRSQMRTAEDVQRFVEQLGLKFGQGDSWVKTGPLKITVDGGIHWGNTYLREPYGQQRTKFYALDDPNYRGDIQCSVDQMAEVFAAGHRLGWQMSCHVTGDAGVDRVLDALDAADKQAPVKDRRFTLIHAYFPTPEAIDRGRRLGICVDTQADLYYKDSDAIAEIYGREWAERFIGLGDWIRGGIPTAINGDHMIGFDPDRAMNSFNPFLHMYIAVSRKNNQGRVYGAHQKVSRMDALRSMTAAAAYLSFDERNRGTLEPGRLADLAALDRDFLACPEEEIRQIKVLMTMVGGQVVYDRPLNAERTGSVNIPRRASQR